MNAPIVDPAKVMPPPAQTNKAFTNQTVPAPPKEEVIRDSEIIAKPLHEPDFINMQPMNKNMSFFWGNRAVGDKESRMRFNQLQAKGFRAAKPSDIEGWNADPEKSRVPDSLVVDGRILYGDLILMIIPKKDYIGQQKFNAQTARMRVQRFGMGKEADGERSVLAGVEEQSGGKIRAFIPSAQEAAALTGAGSDKK